MRDGDSVNEKLRHDSIALGARLRELRRRRGLTLDEVGRNIGVTRACVCQWESGKSYPQRKFIPELARTLETSAAYLVAGDGTGIIVDDQAAAVIRRAKKEIAEALSFDVSRVRIEIVTIA